ALLPRHISRRIAADRIETYEEIYPPLAPGALIAGTPDPRFVTAWRLASAESFLPNANVSYTSDRAPASAAALGTATAQA
ncbi:MAG: hypothetical protein RLT05_05165, partial [Bauldia litoralis]